MRIVPLKCVLKVFQVAVMSTCIITPAPKHKSLKKWCIWEDKNMNDPYTVEDNKIDQKLSPDQLP